MLNYYSTPLVVSLHQRAGFLKGFIAFAGTMVVSLPSTTPATSAEAGDLWVMTPVPLRAPPTIVVITPFIVVSAILGGGDAIEP